MQYGIYGRPKLPRNPYDWVKTGGNSVYSSNSLYSNSSPVGGDMATLMDYIQVFVGATEDTDGSTGIVPAPLAGEQLYFLQGTSSWVDIPAYRWLHEWPYDEGLEKSGLGIEGDFHVGKKLTTLDLDVQGQAHFFELVIDKAKMTGGQLFVSPSLFQIDHLGETVTYVIGGSELAWIRQERPDISKYVSRYSLQRIRCRRLWMKNDDNVDHTYSEVEVGDMMRCRTFNLDGRYTPGGIMKDVSNTDYWSFVCGTGTGTFTNENGDEFEGLWIDLAFAMTGNNSSYPYIPLNTLFRDEDENPITLPDNFVMPDIYNDLKRKTFETLCGSTSITEEFIDDEDTIDIITDYVFRIRGLSYITAGILGVDYADDSLASLFTMLEAADLNNNVLYGSTNNQIDELIYLISGVASYDGITVYNNDYADEVVDDILNGGETQLSETGEEEPELNQNRLKIAERNEWQFGYGTFEPRVGQQLGCLGHMFDINRQNAIVISAINPIDQELVAPSIAQYNGIDVFGVSISQFRLSVLAKNGNVLTGKFMVKSNNGAYIKVDDMIDMYITDITTGLETVGIHLDGENSTITMKGSVELHQHDDRDNDTLSVWNSNNEKKVEIVPTNIPNRNAIAQTNSKSNWSGSTQLTEKVTSTVEKDEDKKGGILWSLIGGHWEYRYRIQSHAVTVTNTFNLGSYSRNDTIDITNVILYSALWNCKFRGYNSVFLRTYGNTVDVTLKLKRENTVVNQQVYSNTQIDADQTSLRVVIPTFLDDFVPDNANPLNYKLEYTLQFYVYSDWTSWSTDNYTGSQIYFDTDIRSDGSCELMVTNEGESFMQIGTNGLVYSVGNGDYYYAGEDGFEFKYKQNMISFNENDGIKIIKKPQLIRSGQSINSEIVLARPSGSYSISTPSNAETGREIVVFGFHGLTINSWSDKRFRIYRNDLNNYSTFDSVTLSTYTAINSNGTSVTLNETRLDMIVLDDGIYLNQAII